MSSWDVFHSDRMEVDRALGTPEVRAGMAAGTIRPDDLIRPAGSSSPWSRLTEIPELTAPEPEPVPADEAVEDEPEVMEMEIVEDAYEADLDLGRVTDLDPDGRLDATFDNPLPPDGFDEAESEELGEYDPQDEDEEAAEFTLARGSAETIEELDLAAMVDVAFQLVLFFLVTATTVLYKSLEVPKPKPDEPPAENVAQGKRTLEEMKKDFILVQIDPQGTIKVDGQPVVPANLIEAMRAAREDGGRKTMLLSADFNTMHRNAVLAYDAANEIGLGIAIARPADPAGTGAGAGAVTPAPSTPAPKAGK